MNYQLFSQQLIWIMMSRWLNSSYGFINNKQKQAILQRAIEANGWLFVAQVPLGLLS